MKYKASLACVVVGAIFTTGLAQAQDDWTRNFRAGVLVGFNIKADFKTSGQFGIPSNPGPAGVANVDHIYDDGYVRPDGNNPTANNWTSFWGYDNASQYDPNNNTLTFHSANGVTLQNSTSSGRDESPYVGVDLAYGGTFGRSGRARLGWELGFDFLPISIRDNRDLSGTFTRTAHTFDTSAIVVPSAGYQGQAGGLGPNIPNFATAVNEPPTAGILNGSRKLDVDLIALRLGPTFYWNLHPRWAISVSGGGAVGLITGDYRFDESVTFASSGTTHISGKFGKTEPIYGGYFNSVLLFHLQPDADLFIGAQFMPMTGVHFSQGGREAKLGMDGAVYLTAGINWPF